MRNLSDFEHDELIMLHEDLNRAVTETRQRAWSTTNYVALLHVGGIGYIKLFTYPHSCWILVILMLSSLLITSIGICIVYETIDDSDEIRDRMAALKPYFGVPYVDDWNNFVMRKYQKKGRDKAIALPLCGIQALLWILFLCYLYTILCDCRW